MAVSQQVSQDQQSGQQQVTKVLSYFIEKDGYVYNFHGVSAGQNFDAYTPAFESTMTNFSLLTDRTKLNVKPDRIKVISIRSTTVSVEEALRYYKVPEDKLKELALLNNMELDHKLKKGEKLKVLGK